MARSRRTPTVLILPMPLVAFQPRKPAPGGPATAFPWTENKCEPPEESFILVLGLVVEKLRAAWVDQSPSRFPRLRSGQALRLRATSAVSRDRSVKRFVRMTVLREFRRKTS